VIIRPARLADSDGVLALRNDPDAVRFSPSREPVSAEEHARWFPNAAAMSPLFYVAASLGTVAGFVRVDALAWVSVAVAAAQRGRGLGRELVACAASIFPGDVRAQVHEENVPSLRLFAACGFRELHRDAPWVYFEMEKER